MNNTNLFLNASKECRNSEALWRIRRAASKRSDSRREDEFQDDDDGQLLPTIPRLRQAFPNEAELQPILTECDCHLCTSQYRIDDDDTQQSLAAEILQSDDKLRAFAILVLSGCLFAWTEFSRRGSDDLDGFSKRVKADNAAGAELRRRLFGHATIEPDECTHDERAKRSLRRQCPDCAGLAFRECVRAKRRLLQIPILRRSNDIQEFDEFDNLPFIQEDQDQLEDPKPTLRFWKCRIEPTHCSSDELKDNELFRKRYRFSPDDRGVKNAMNEAKVAIALGSLEHANIAKILLAFREDSDYTYINMVYKREQHNLDDFFRQPALASILGGFRGRVGVHTVVLDHGLWKALLGIVDAVATIHEVVKGKVSTKRPGPAIYGHFDIKPANILIGEGGNLLLTDFGQAATRSIGTSDYAPPEHENNLHLEPVESYDVWSLACVLLQALVYIAAIADGDDSAGTRALDTFYSNRLNQTTRNRAGAFWIREDDSKALRKAVTEELNRLEGRRHHQTQVVVSQLREMFNFIPTDRPPLRSCFRRFTAGLGRDVFRIPGDRMVEPKLADWITSFTTDVQHDTIPCRLYLYFLQSQVSEINLTLEYEGEPSTHSRSEVRRVEEASFVPVSFYDSMEPLRRRRHSNNSRDTAVILSCAFENLFRGITLSFHKADDYFEFMALTTRQQLLPDVRSDRLLSGATIRFKSCVLVEKGKLPPFVKRYIFETGVVQIWKRLDDAAYTERYEHGEETVDHGIQRALPVERRRRIMSSPIAQISQYKMALFGREKGLPACLIVDIGFVSYSLKVRPMRFGFASAKEGTFQAKIYQRAEGYPGFPLSPTVLDRDMAGEGGIKIRTVELEMHSDPDFQTLRDVLNEQGFRFS